MNKKQVIEILEYLGMSYPNFGDIESKLGFWYDTLQYYNYLDVKDRLYDLMQLKEFGLAAPNLSRIVAPLTKIKDKMENKDFSYYCMFCRRIFNDYDELCAHEDRCRSVKYIVRQYERFNLGTVDKAKLYNMPSDEFDEKYNKLLKIVQQRTGSAEEKQIIEYIFNPPTPDETKAILNEGLHRQENFS